MKTEAEVRKAASFLDSVNGLYDDSEFETRDALIVRSAFAWVLGESLGDLDGWAEESMPDLESLLWLSPGVLSNSEAYYDE